MNALELLREDHAAMVSLLQQAQVGSDANPQSTSDPRPIDRLAAAFAIHASLEKRIFYPAFENFCDARRLVSTFSQVNDTINRLLADLCSGEGFEEEKEAKLFRLRDLVQQHLDDHERLMFVPAQELLGAPILDQLARKMEAMKSRRAQSATGSLAD
jgi:hypothetical protein